MRSEWDVIARTRKPDYMLMGHLHRPIAGSWRGIPFHIQRALTHQVDFEAEGHIPGTHKSPDYALVNLHRGNIVIHQCSFLYDGPAFSFHDARAQQSQSLGELVDIGLEHFREVDRSTLPHLTTALIAAVHVGTQSRSRCHQGPITVAPPTAAHSAGSTLVSQLPRRRRPEIVHAFSTAPSGAFCWVIYG